MKIKAPGCGFKVSDELANIIISEIDRSNVDESRGVVINFRAPDYSAESGGYHPVEVAVSQAGDLIYVTDFSFVGMPPYAELVKELDFDLEQGVFEHQNTVYPISHGKDLWIIWQQNFVAYHSMGVYESTVEVLS